MNSLVRWFGAVAIFGAITLAAIPVSAQEVSLGYQWQQVSVGLDEFDDPLDIDPFRAPLGFNVDVAGPITPSVDIVGQFDWSRWNKSEVILGTSVDLSANFTTFGGGLRWSGRTNPSATPFVQALFGATRSSAACEVAGVDCDDFADFGDSSSTDPMLQIGGGIAVPMGGWSVLGQIDYRRIFAEDEGVNSIRFVVGVRLGIR